ncbi:hypothetical protein KY334_08200, partial [Candidatus Woesearchaeota archaeon]|nr:hypothetical protein [Candidatus Woesearchaeota archaeon]
ATQSITSGIDLSALTNSPLPTPSSSITPTDFRIFAVSTIVILNIFSAILNGILKTGKAAKGLPLIIPYVVISLIVFLISSKVLSGFLSSFV